MRIDCRRTIEVLAAGEAVLARNTMLRESLAASNTPLSANGTPTPVSRAVASGENVPCLRPYLSAVARARFVAAVARGEADQLGVIDGDVLHVPWSRAEFNTVQQHGLSEKAVQHLPGRTLQDLIRFFDDQNNAALSLEPDPPLVFRRAEHCEKQPSSLVEVCFLFKMLCDRSLLLS